MVSLLLFNGLPTCLVLGTYAMSICLGGRSTCPRMSAPRNFIDLTYTQSLHAPYVVEHLTLIFYCDAFIFHMQHVQIEYAPHFLVHESLQFEQQVLAQGSAFTSPQE